MTRIIAEAILWTAVITLVATLTSCDEEKNQPGSRQECVLTSQGEVCRTPDGIK